MKKFKLEIESYLEEHGVHFTTVWVNAYGNVSDTELFGHIMNYLYQEGWTMIFSQLYRYKKKDEYSPLVCQTIPINDSDLQKSVFDWAQVNEQGSRNE